MAEKSNVPVRDVHECRVQFARIRESWQRHYDKLPLSQRADCDKFHNFSDSQDSAVNGFLLQPCAQTCIAMASFPDLKATYERRGVGHLYQSPAFNEVYMYAAAGMILSTNGDKCAKSGDFCIAWAAAHAIRIMNSQPPDEEWSAGMRFAAAELVNPCLCARCAGCPDLPWAMNIKEGMSSASPSPLKSPSESVWDRVTKLVSWVLFDQPFVWQRLVKWFDRVCRESTRYHRVYCDVYAQAHLKLDDVLTVYVSEARRVYNAKWLQNFVGEAVSANVCGVCDRNGEGHEAERLSVVLSAISSGFQSDKRRILMFAATLRSSHAHSMFLEGADFLTKFGPHVQISCRGACVLAFLFGTLVCAPVRNILGGDCLCDTLSLLLKHVADEATQRENLNEPVDSMHVQSMHDLLQFGMRRCPKEEPCAISGRLRRKFFGKRSALELPATPEEAAAYARLAVDVCSYWWTEFGGEVQGLISATLALLRFHDKIVDRVGAWKCDDEESWSEADIKSLHRATRSDDLRRTIDGVFQSEAYATFVEDIREADEPLRKRQEARKQKLQQRAWDACADLILQEEREASDAKTPTVKKKKGRKTKGRKSGQATNSTSPVNSDPGSLSAADADPPLGLEYQVATASGIQIAAHDGIGECAVCFEQFTNELGRAILLPCRHAKLCVSCSRNLFEKKAQCPYCSIDILEVIDKVFV